MFVRSGFQFGKGCGLAKDINLGNYVGLVLDINLGDVLVRIRVLI